MPLSLLPLRIDLLLIARIILVEGVEFFHK